MGLLLPLIFSLHLTISSVFLGWDHGRIETNRCGLLRELQKYIALGDDAAAAAAAAAFGGGQIGGGEGEGGVVMMTH